MKLENHVLLGTVPLLSASTSPSVGRHAIYLEIQPLQNIDAPPGIGKLGARRVCRECL